MIVVEVGVEGSDECFSQDYLLAECFYCILSSLMANFFFATSEEIKTILEFISGDLLYQKLFII